MNPPKDKEREYGADVKENEASYRLFFDAGVDGMLLASSDGTISDANRRACDLLQRAREELVGSRLDDLSDPSYPILGAAWEELHITGRFYVAARLLSGDGTSFPAQVWVAGDDKGEFSVVFREIARLEEGETPRASAAEYRAMVENSVDAMMISGPDNTIRYVNPAFERLGGYKPEELVGTFAPDIVHPEDLARAAALVVKIENTPGPTRIPGDFRYRHKDGHWIYLETSLNNLTHDPNVRGLVAICRDVTERRLAEEALRESEERLTRANEELARSNRELEQFAYVVSHGLRSPLRSMAGLSRILLEDYSKRLDEEGRYLLQSLQSSNQHMEQLVEDILNLSRVMYSPLRRETVDLSAVARSIVAERNENWPEREVEFAAEEGLVAEGDPGLLRVVLENLLGNAWKYTHKLPRAKIEFGAVEREGARVYYVRDDGVGFDPAHAGQLFEPFGRLHRASEYEGTGIGLATVERIVSRHGGEVWAEGEVGCGATFYFTLGGEPDELTGRGDVG